MINMKIFLLIPILAFSLSCSATNNLDDNVPNVKPDSPRVAWDKDWWEKRHNAKIKQAKNAEIDLLMLGDSITHRWEMAGSAVWQQYYQDKNAFNLGFSGDKTEQVLWRLQNGAVDNMSPKLTVLMIGTNNTGQRMDPAEDTAKGISAIVSELRTRLPMSKILLLGIFPRNHSPNDEMRLRNQEINQLIRSLDDNKSVYFLNINEIFIDDKQILNQKLMPDLLHPNSEGYQRWAEAMAPTINRLMN
ncbi:platelet-activating factor acetylhydrolase IB subunit [Vibrio sp. RC27]